jgi:hypothetical protein
MGEVFHALEVLNRTMKLGLNSSDLLRAEMGFKSVFAQHGNPDPGFELPTDPIALAEGYELVSTLRPREEPLPLRQLSTYARQATSRPRVRVDAKTLKQIDKALEAATAAKSKAPAKKTGA